MSQNRARGSAKTQERFSTVEGPRVQRSAFDRSFSHKTTIDSGLLYPIFVDEVLPGDTLSLRPAFFARMATPLKPFMDGLHLDYQFFYTPLRLLWDNFVRMMGERPAPGDHNDYTVPQMVAPATVGHLNGSLSDYLTLPTDIPDYTHSSLFHRNYNLIHREWFRDENLQEPAVVPMGDGPDLDTLFPLLRRGKRKDYFSGALLTAQKGDPVSISLGATAPVVSAGTGIPTFDTLLSTTPDPLKVVTGTGDQEVFYNVSGGESGNHDLEWAVTSLEADLSAASAITINAMRTALGIQHLLERDARGGTRYREQVLAHFGVHTDDIRLMRPELLGTGSTTVQAHATPQTTQFQGAGQTVLGTIGAYATAAAVGRGFVKTFTEHGIVMGLCSIRAELTYQQGLHRMFRRNSRYEFFWPDLANLGEQQVQSGELYTDGTGDPIALTGDFSTWGFQPRYEEYRHRTSVITGQFRSNFAQSLDIWHLGLDFATRPVLNAAFIEENPPVQRVIHLTTEPEFLLDTFFKIQHVRPMPKFGTPGMTRF